MKPLYSEYQYQAAKSNDLLVLCCLCCNKTFYATKKTINSAMKSNNRITRDYCSSKCAGASRKTNIKVQCNQCGKTITKLPCELSKNNFCNRSCSSVYRNTHKSNGYRRSKLEIWLEDHLTHYYEFDFQFNKTNAINSELDIYIPSLNLAFELNGIFHYEPIYGNEKLIKTKNNDNRKMQACLENNIELCIIDASGLKYFKPEKAKTYLDIIKKIIQDKIAITIKLLHQ